MSYLFSFKIFKYFILQFNTLTFGETSKGAKVSYINKNQNFVEKNTGSEYHQIINLSGKFCLSLNKIILFPTELLHL